MNSREAQYLSASDTMTLSRQRGMWVSVSGHMWDVMMSFSVAVRLKRREAFS